MDERVGDQPDADATPAASGDPSGGDPSGGDLPGDGGPGAAWLGLLPVLLLLALAAITLAGGDDRRPAAATTTQPPASPPRGPDVAAVLGGDPRLGTLGELLLRTGMDDVLGGPGPFTVFAPDDTAFAALPVAALDALRRDPALAQRVVAHHLVRGRAGAGDLRPGGTGILTALDGAPLTVAVTGGRLEVGGATLVQPDQGASNGVVHVIDAVILPPGVTLPEPPAPKPPTEVLSPPTTAGTIVDVVRAAGRFDQLAALIDRAGLADRLGEAGPFTLFAPTDEAFARVPKERLDALTADPATAGPRLALAESRFTVTFEAGRARVAADRDQPATIVHPDVGASNGVVHVIDAVLVPPDLPGG